MDFKFMLKMSHSQYIYLGPTIDIKYKSLKDEQLYDDNLIII